jgi:hypothetical protein
VGGDEDWVIDGDDVYRTTGKVGIGAPATARPASGGGGETRLGDLGRSTSKLYVRSENDWYGLLSETLDTDAANDGRAAILGLRWPLVANPGSGYSFGGANTGVTGISAYGEEYTFGVAGYTDAAVRAGGVLGASMIGSSWAALAYTDASGQQWGAYTPDDVYVGGSLRIPTGASDGYVLTSDAQGLGTWQAVPAGIGGTGTVDYLPKFTGPSTLGNSSIRETSGGGIAIDTPASGTALYADGGTNTAVHLTSTGTEDSYTLLAENSEGSCATFLSRCTVQPDTFGAVAVRGVGEGLSAGGLFTSDGSGDALIAGSLGSGDALVGTSYGSGYAIHGRAYGTGEAGHFSGDVAVHWGRLDVQADEARAGSFTSDYPSTSTHVVHGEFTGTSGIDAVGVHGESTPADYYGIGGRFYGGYMGMSAAVNPTGDHTYYGARGYVSGGTGTNYALYGWAYGAGSNYGVYTYVGGGANNWAGYFYGPIFAQSASAGIKAFKIDHPLEPETKYLNHSSVESPDMMNIYNGNTVLDGSGRAWVDMPDWFEALNRDFRYQLTAIGAAGPDLHVATEISGNQFQIAGGTPGMKVSWQVTGVRQDPLAEAHRVQVEEEKAPGDVGRYLFPEVYGLSREAGIGYVEEKQESVD